MYPKMKLFTAVLVCALLASCGGGASDDEANTVAGTPSGGIVVDGYLQLAKMVCDANENGAADAGESVTYTDTNGNYTFASGCAHTVLASGGVNKDTGLSFVGQMRSPAGAPTVTPLTTLLAAGMTQEQIVAALNLPAGTDVLTTDPAATDSNGNLKNPALMKKTVAVQQMMQKVTELFAELGSMSGSVAINSVYNNVASAFATQLKTAGAALFSGDTVQEGQVSAMIGKAVTVVGSAGDVDQKVKDALTAAGGAAAVSAVVQTALTDQAQSIMKASDAADLTAVTREKQSNAGITASVKEKVSLGELKPGLTADQLAKLKSDIQLGAAMASGNSAIIDFDEQINAFSNIGPYGGAKMSIGMDAVAKTKALKIEKPAGVEKWAGVYLTVAPISFSAGNKSISALVYSTHANAVAKLKVDTSPSLGQGNAPEVEGTIVESANSWTKVTWDFSKSEVPLNLNLQYTTIAITPDADMTTSGQAYYIDSMAVAPSNSGYLYLANDSIGFTPTGQSADAVAYSMTKFKGDGLDVKWPMADGAALKINLREKGTFNFANGQELSAAISISEIGPNKNGELRAVVENVQVRKSGSYITLTIPNLPRAMVYAVSSNGNTKSVIDFAAKVQGIRNTLTASANTVSTVGFGEVVNYAIGKLSNRFSDMSLMRGKYKLTMVVSELPLRKEDGTAFEAMSMTVPTKLSNGGGIDQSVGVTGAGLTGYINLVD